MELAWNTQKNQMSDVKGKEKEQEREGEIKNNDIDPERTKNNYDLVESDKNLYQRVKERVDHARETGSRVQKNSVVMYSNILTVPENQAEVWGEERTKQYFEACKDYFSKEFGKENVVSAKVHLDETAPHMHLHFVPFNKETGKLQARVAMDKKKINQIHNDLPKFLRERGFEVERGTGKTKDKNIENVHEYKETQKKIDEKKKELQAFTEKVPVHLEVKPRRQMKQVEVETDEKNLFGMRKKEMQKEPTGNVILPENDFKKLVAAAKANKELKGKMEKVLNTDYAKEVESLKAQNQFIYEEYQNQKKEKESLKKENTKLRWDNHFLKEQVNDLKRDMKIVYQTTKQFVKEHARDLKAFKSAFKGLSDKIHEKTQKTAERGSNEPRTNEFIQEHRKSLRKERDRGIER
jgi:virulence-associated protein VapD